MNWKAYLGATMESNVNMTSGGAVFGDAAAGGLPNNITVSPDNTLLTRAIPTGGNCNNTLVVAVAVAGVATIPVVETDAVVDVDGVTEEIFMDAMSAAALEGGVVISLSFYCFSFVGIDTL